MSLRDNTKKIQELFNKMQKAIIKFDELIFPHEYIAFEIYKIHIETLLIIIEDNITAKLSLALFRQLFEKDNEFNECTDKKANYINLFIDYLNAIGTKDEKETEDDMQSEIYTVLFNIKNKGDKMLMKNLVMKLKNQLKIKSELYYLLFILLVETGFNLQILTDYLPQVLKQKYPDSTFDFSDAIKSGLNFNEFIELFLSVTESNYDYATFKYNKETKSILITHQSIDEINNIIMSTSTEKKKKHKKKDKKHQNIQVHTENKISDRQTKDSNIDKEKKIENDNNNEVSKERACENTQILNEKERDKINNIGIIGIQENNKAIDNEKKSDETKSITLEEVRKIINENNHKINSKFEAEIEKLKKDNEKIKIGLTEEIEHLNDDKKQMMDEIKHLNDKIKKLENNNKNLNKSNKDINCKIMQNKKKISQLEFDIKTIGLRDAYKSFIDLLVFIMDLDMYGNLETKIASIINAIKSLKNKNVEKIKLLLNDTSDLLTFANNKAHYINFNEDIIGQLICNLSKFSGNKEYLGLIDILKNMNIENELEKLVKNRVEKFTKSKEDFIKNQKIIKDTIQNNPLIAKGNGFAKLINS